MSRHKPGPFTMNEAVQTTCRACGGFVSVGYVDGDEETGEPTVMHAEPICSTFMRLDMLAYLRFLNEGLPNDDPN